MKYRNPLTGRFTKLPIIIVGDAMCKPLWENLKVDNDYRLRDAWIRAKERHSLKENISGLIEAGDKMADRMPALDDRMGIPLQYAWKYAKTQYSTGFHQ